MLLDPHVTLERDSLGTATLPLPGDRTEVSDPLHDSSFGQIVTPYLPAMVRAAQSILGSEDLAWDAVQETLLRVWVRGWLPENPRGALIHLVVKSSQHQLRCRNRRDYHESRGDELGGPCCEADPFEQLEGVERALAVREALHGIAEEYRSVLELHELEGESYAAIAGRLDLPIGTIRSRLSRGRALLRERLPRTEPVA